MQPLTALDRDNSIYNHTLLSRISIDSWPALLAEPSAARLSGHSSPKRLYCSENQELPLASPLTLG